MKGSGVLWMVALAAMSGPCGKKTSEEGPTDGASASADGGAAGDPVVALARAAVATCKVDDGGNIDTDCAAYKALDGSPLVASGAGDASLVLVLDDPSDVVRSLGYDQLRSHGQKVWTDKDLAGHLLSAVEKEPAGGKVSFYNLGQAVGRINVKPTGTLERVKALAKTPKDPTFSQQLVATQGHRQQRDRRRRLGVAEGPPQGPRRQDPPRGHQGVLGQPVEPASRADVRPLQGQLLQRRSGGRGRRRWPSPAASEKCIADEDAAIAEVRPAPRAGLLPGHDRRLRRTTSRTWSPTRGRTRRSRTSRRSARSASPTPRPPTASSPSRVRRIALEAVKSADPTGYKASRADARERQGQGRGRAQPRRTRPAK